MTENSTKLNDLIEILRDGKTFYDDASTKVTDPTLRQLFRDMSSVRGAVIADLSAEVRMEGAKPAEGGTMAGGLRKVYADALAALTSDKNTTYVNQLEAAEDRLLHAFEDAMKSTDSPKVAEILSRHSTKVRQMHDLMRSQKQMRNAA